MTFAQLDLTTDLLSKFDFQFSKLVHPCSRVTQTVFCAQSRLQASQTHRYGVLVRIPSKKPTQVNKALNFSRIQLSSTPMLTLFTRDQCAKDWEFPFFQDPVLFGRRRWPLRGPLLPMWLPVSITVKVPRVGKGSLPPSTSTPPTTKVMKSLLCRSWPAKCP